MTRPARASRVHATEFTPRPATPRRAANADRPERAPLPGGMRQRDPLTLTLPVAGDLAALTADAAPAPAADLPPSQIRHDRTRVTDEPTALLDTTIAPLKTPPTAPESPDPTRELPAVSMYQRAYESGDWPDETKPRPTTASSYEVPHPVGTPAQETARLWSIRRSLMATLTPHREADEAGELARAADAAALRNDLRTDRLEQRMESLQRWWNGLRDTDVTALLPRIAPGPAPLDLDALVATLVDLPADEYERKLAELLNADGPVAA